MGFADNVKAELDFQDIQVKELSSMTGISKNTLDKYLFGKNSQPGVENAVKIAQSLGVTVEYLVRQADGSVLQQKKQDREHQNLLRQYDTLDDFNKQTVQDLLASLARRM